MKFLFACLLFLPLARPLFAQQHISEDFHQWAPTPPMGWNSWDCFGPTVTEEEVKQNADYMAKHLKSSGWEYIVVDIRWFVSNDKAHGYNQEDPVYNLDEYGRFIPAPNRFPSSRNGQGFKPLADYVHSLGLKFGIHIMRGVPVVAVNQKLPVKGTGVSAADIYSRENQCTWLRDMYTILPSKPGSQEYYNSIFELYAEWGVDFVKVDDLSSPIYFAEEVEMIRKAIDRTGRKILLSTSPGETPLQYAGHVQANANMWRTVGDFWDSWKQLKEHFEVFSRWNKYRITGAYPDGDMLPMGRLSIRGERGDDRITAFTRDEQYTLMTLWAIFRSPLMFGGNLPDNDAFTNSLLTNKEVLQVLNASVNNRELLRTADKVIWIADDTFSDDKYLAFFNIMDQEEAIESNALYISPLITKETKGQSHPIDVDLKGARKLFLVVSEGGDNMDWDHANWLHPTVYNGRDTLALTSIPWKNATAGWGTVKVNGSVSGGKLVTGGREYKNGIGTHSHSVIEYDIPEGYTHFRALAGIDNASAEQNAGCSMKFMIFTKNPSGPLPPPSQELSVVLKDLGFPSGASVRNLWSGKELGMYRGKFSAQIPRHSAALYRLSRQKQSRSKK